MNCIISRDSLHRLVIAFGVLLFFPAAALLAQIDVQSTQAKADIVAIPQTLKAENCPPVLLSLQNEYNSHLKSYYLSSVLGVSNGSENRKPIILVKEMNNPVRLMEYELKNSVFSLSAKQEIPVLDTIYDLYPSPNNSLYLFNADDMGDGQYQFYLYNPKTKKNVRLVSEGRNVEPVWSQSERSFAYGTAKINQEGMSLAVAELTNKSADNEAAKSRIVATTNFMLTAQDWSPDGNHLAYIEYFSNRNSSALWLVNLKTNEKILISPKNHNFQQSLTQSKNSSNTDIPKGEVIAAQFAPDGKKLYFAANHEGDHIRVFSNDLINQRTILVAEKKGFDVEAFRLSQTGKRIAVVYDIDGASRLFISDYDGSQTKEAILPFPGVIQNLTWSKDDKFLAFNFTSAQLPAAIMYVEIDNAEKLKTELVASSPTLSTAEKLNLPKAESISWKAEDGLLLKGWMFKSSGKNNLLGGKRPVIIDIHGGPEEAVRSEYPETDAYYLDALGAAVVYPNVRGSTGRGKSFLDADNGLKRGDAVKDFGKLFEWIASQPDLDQNRVMLRGFSYGGYMALLVAATYPNQIAAVEVEAAPTNLVTFLQTTSGWRRAQRRNEYGDERDPKIRAGLEKIAPRNLTSTLRMPLFIAAGMRDPRVPASEGEKFISAVRAQGNKNVWSLLASDDGHGLTGENDEYRSLLAAEFFKRFVAGKKVEKLQKTQNKN
jgi:dipeptidyl aminopeptidase/acylaminoacyl peptidase